MSKTKPTKPLRLKDVTHWDIEADVVVVGYGGAGACAAIEAADAGADVLLLEVASDGGGSTELSSAEMYLGGGGGTRVQRAAGFEDRSEDMINYLLMCQGEQADEAKVRAYVEGGVEHFDWLVGLGVPFKDSFLDERVMVPLTDDGLVYTGNEQAWPFNQVAKPCPRGHSLKVEGDNGGPMFFNILRQQIQQRERIRVEFNARVLTLVANRHNHVQGVVVRMNQKEHVVRARKGVILCAGGFAMNEAMLKKYAPFLTKANVPLGNPGDTGAGILMGMGVGAAAINMHEGFITLPFYPPASLTNGIFVNAQGQRFINEDSYHGRVGYHCLAQLKQPIYLIANVEDFDGYEPKASYMQADFAGTAEESVAELEQELGLPTGSLEATIELYNRYAEQGEDPLFHKQPEWLKPLRLPLAAIDCSPDRAYYSFFTFGGLDTLPTGEVLTPEGEVIPGLYAAGRTSCGIPRRAVGYASGSSVGDATFFGRMAGKSAAGREVQQAAEAIAE